MFRHGFKDGRKRNFRKAALGAFTTEAQRRQGFLRDFLSGLMP
jgi:hypothetical protein